MASKRPRPAEPDRAAGERPTVTLSGGEPCPAGQVSLWRAGKLVRCTVHADGRAFQVHDLHRRQAPLRADDPPPRREVASSRSTASIRKIASLNKKSRCGGSSSIVVHLADERMTRRRPCGGSAPGCWWVWSQKKHMRAPTWASITTSFHSGQGARPPGNASPPGGF